MKKLIRKILDFFRKKPIKFKPAAPRDMELNK